MNRYCVLTLICMLMHISATAQEMAELSGRIISADDKSPIDFADVYLKGTKFWCVPDGKGFFHLNAQAGTYILVIKAMGFETVEEEVTLSGKDSTIRTFRLEYDRHQLDEVVVVSKRSSHVQRSAFNAMDLSVKENLDYFATLFGTTVKENYDNIKEIYSQIEPFADRRAGKLSGGMKQKLALCCALVHKPSVLFLDEPTTGVDAVSRKDFWTMLARIKASGVTVFVSTPYMDEAAMCDRLALIRDGVIIGTGTPEEIISGFPFRLLSVRGRRMYPMLKQLRKTAGVITCFSFGDSHHVTYSPEVTGKAGTPIM